MGLFSDHCTVIFIRKPGSVESGSVVGEGRMPFKTVITFFLAELSASKTGLVLSLGLRTTCVPVPEREETHLGTIKLPLMEEVILMSVIPSSNACCSSSAVRTSLVVAEAQKTKTHKVKQIEIKQRATLRTTILPSLTKINFIPSLMLDCQSKT